MHGLRVLVTRPAHQAESLVQRIEAAGGEAVRLPTIEIVAPQDTRVLQDVVTRLTQFHIVIFISANAVRQFLPYLPGTGGFAPDQRLAAVGRATRRALFDAGYEPVLTPVERYDSEALLELLPANDVAGKQVLIVRGEGGHQLLGESLAQRGAQVTYAECYRRVVPSQPDARILARLQQADIDVLILTSIEGARNLCTLAGESGRAALLSTPAVVVSTRLARTCRELGFHAHLEIAAQASDAGIVDALRAWRTRQKSL